MNDPEERTHYELLCVTPNGCCSVATFGHRNDKGALRAAEKVVRETPRYEYELAVVSADGDSLRSVKVWEPR